MTSTLRPEHTPATSPVAERLLRSSLRHSYDPEVDIDWDAPIDPTLWGMTARADVALRHPPVGPAHPEQQITLSQHEVASIASVGLWFELLLMQMMLRDAYATTRPARTCTTP